ncbi:MAG TPA: radical SAM protein, partial [Terriglobales bacterium]
LVEGVLALVRKHRPIQVSLVGGEPLVRRRELDRILPELGRMGVFAMVVTSAVAPIPENWMAIPRFCVAVSVDGLPEHHDVRRKPATYERILKNISGRRVNVHWVITKPMMERPEYLEEYVAFWSARPEVNHMWVSLYTPQIGEQSPEILTADDRKRLARELPLLRLRYPKFLVNQGMADAFLTPPADPQHCLFAKMSMNYSADLKTRVEPCVFGGNPDCSQCGCSISSTLHWVKDVKVAGAVKVGSLVSGSMAVGSVVAHLRSKTDKPPRWQSTPPVQESSLVQISS